MFLGCYDATVCELEVLQCCPPAANYVDRVTHISVAFWLIPVRPRRRISSMVKPEMSSTAPWANVSAGRSCGLYGYSKL
jgi:hypothetical protein